MPSKFAEAQSPLLAEDTEGDYDAEHFAALKQPSSPTSRRRDRISRLLIILSAGLNIILLGYVIFERAAPRSNTESQSYVDLQEPQTEYSPASSAISHETKVFGTFTTRSKYNGGPSDEVDAAWSELYWDYTLAAITSDEAAMLRNTTALDAGSKKTHIINLNIFHQLHCLNMVRKALYPDHYGRHDHFNPPTKEGEKPFDHIDHCVNTIREALMCTSDVTPNVLQWDAETKRNWIHLDVPHTCRKFEDIQKWVADRPTSTPGRPSG